MGDPAEDAGMGLSELTAFTAETWGCRRNALRLDACYGSEHINTRSLFQQVGRLERIARKAENAGQFSAAVGAITALIIRVILCLYDFVRGNFLAVD